MLWSAQRLNIISYIYNNHHQIHKKGKIYDQQERGIAKVVGGGHDSQQHGFDDISPSSSVAAEEVVVVVGWFGIQYGGGEDKVWIYLLK